MTSNLPFVHNAFLEQLIKVLEKDIRFESLLAGGSIIHGGLDEHSDLDFLVVVRADHYEVVMKSRTEFARQLPGLLSAFTGEHVGEPRLLICLYGPKLLHVDFKFIVPSDLLQIIERPAILWEREPGAMALALDNAHISWPDLQPEWFEERSWIWLHYAATKLQRGELFEAIGMLAFFREQVLGPLFHRRAGRPQRGVRRIELQDVEAAEALKQTIAGHTKPAVSRALKAAAKIYLELRNDNPPAEVTKGMPEYLLPMLEF
jgi:hypothetical protein